MRVPDVLRGPTGLLINWFCELTTNQECVEIYLHSPIHIHGVQRGTLKITYFATFIIVLTL